MTEHPHMWEYWRDKKGLVDALKDYYPNTLADSLPLQTALAQIEMAERSINSYMLELKNDEDDSD